MSKPELAPIRLLEAHAEDLRSLGAGSIGIFGSFARGEETEDSDIDVYLEFLPGRKSFDNLCAIYRLLERLFQRPVDLVTDGALSERKARLILPTVRYASLGS